MNGHTPPIRNGSSVITGVVLIVIIPSGRYLPITVLKQKWTTVGAGYTMTEWQRRTMTSLVSIRYRPIWCDRNFFIRDSPIVQWGGSDYRIYCIWYICAYENIPFQLLCHYCHSRYLYHTLVEHSHSAVL